MSCGFIFPLFFLLIVLLFFAGIVTGLLIYLARLKKRLKAIGDTLLSKVNVVPPNPPPPSIRPILCPGRASLWMGRKRRDKTPAEAKVGVHQIVR